MESQALARLVKKTGSFQGKVLLNQRITLPDAAEDVRHIELEVDSGPAFEPGSNIGVLVPGPHAFGNEHHIRLYTLSGADTFPGTGKTNLQICVRRCLNIDEFSGEAYRGVASNYLCDAQADTILELAGPVGSPFLIPKDYRANLLMIGLGTGIAPFRHFVRYIYDTLGGWEGRVRLFYGARSGLEMLYMNDHQHDFARYYDERTFRAFESVSPRPHLDEPAALYDSLVGNRLEVWELIESPRTYVYIAGVERIRVELERAFAFMADSVQNWERLKRKMIAEGRWTELLY